MPTETEQEKQERELWIKGRDELFANPSPEKCYAWWRANGHPPPASPTVPQAAVHKARLQWLGATDEQLAESMEWLIDNSYSTSFRGCPPLTPEQRDSERIAQGKEPLNK